MPGDEADGTRQLREAVCPPPPRRVDHVRVEFKPSGVVLISASHIATRPGATPSRQPPKASMSSSGKSRRSRQRSGCALAAFLVDAGPVSLDATRRAAGRLSRAIMISSPVRPVRAIATGGSSPRGCSRWSWTWSGHSTMAMSCVHAEGSAPPSHGGVPADARRSRSMLTFDCRPGPERSCARSGGGAIHIDRTRSAAQRDET